MTYLLVPISFLVGGIAGGLLAWTWRGRGSASEAPTRRQKIKLVAATALATTLLIAISGYAVIRLRFSKTEMQGASSGEALADYRKTRGGTATAHRSGTPPGGVYTYNTKGYLKASSGLLGNEHHPMPKSIPAVLVPKGECWELTLRIFKQNSRTERYCKDESAGLRLEERWEDNEMFGVKNFTRQRCDPPRLMDSEAAGRPGSTWKTIWKVVEHTTSMPFPMSRPDLHMDVTYVGLTKLKIGGQMVPAHQLKQSAKYGGAMRGTLDREVWYAVDTGMMLQLKVKSLGSGLGSLTIDRQFTLASLTPKQ